jgi:O-antigen/teichoic acid export membrane protein
LASAAVSVLMAFGAPYLADSVFGDHRMAALVLLAALAVIPVALYNLHAAALQGLGRIADATLVLNAWVWVFAAGLTWLLAEPLGAQGAVWAYVIAAGITLMIGFLRWRRFTPQLRNVVPRFRLSELREMAPPMFFVNVVQLSMNWSGVLLLGVWHDAAEVGTFGVAHRASLVIHFSIVAIISMAGPKFAVLYRQQRFGELRHAARRATAIMLIGLAPVMPLFLVTPQWVMGIFGPEFKAGASVLAVLAAGQFLSIVGGSASSLLAMTDNQRLLRNNAAVVAALQLFLSFVLIPSHGAMGAAVGTAAAVSGLSLGSAVLVWLRLGFSPFPVPQLRRHAS